MQFRSQDRRQLLSLLRAASQGRQDLTLASFTEAQLHWAIETGLGPLLVRTTAADPEAPRSPLWPLLQGTDLLARMLTGEQLDAMSEILDACEGHVPPVTLLKGISICEQHYPAPSLRPMRDIDFLVEEAALPAIESLLHKLGYRQQSNFPPEFYATHHHSMPFVHPQRGLWVEVHRGLFPSSMAVAADKVFGHAHVITQLLPSIFRGRPVTRFSDALQIVYIAAHWALDLKGLGGMVAMLDLIYLLQHSQDTVRWKLILDWLDGSVAATYLYLMLTYLTRHQLISVPPETLDELSARQRSLGVLNLTIMHAMIDRYIVAGRPFGRIWSANHLNIVWKALLAPGPPVKNLLSLPWHFLSASRLGAGCSRWPRWLLRGSA